MIADSCYGSGGPEVSSNHQSTISNHQFLSVTP
jgi:hypothetical protein